jgi:hypothetical protein
VSLDSRDSALLKSTVWILWAALLHNTNAFTDAPIVLLLSYTDILRLGVNKICQEEMSHESKNWETRESFVAYYTVMEGLRKTTKNLRLTAPNRY